jgi:hypothetical protein
MRFDILGLIVIAIGIILILISMASFAAWQHDYDNMKTFLEHFNRTKAIEDCYYLEQPCNTNPTLPRYDTTITLLAVAGSIICAGGGAIIVYGMKHENKVKVG